MVVVMWNAWRIKWKSWRSWYKGSFSISLAREFSLNSLPRQLCPNKTLEQLLASLDNWPIEGPPVSDITVQPAENIDTVASAIHSALDSTTQSLTNLHDDDNYPTIDLAEELGLLGLVAPNSARFLGKSSEGFAAWRVVQSIIHYTGEFRNPQNQNQKPTKFSKIAKPVRSTVYFFCSPYNLLVGTEAFRCNHNTEVRLPSHGPRPPMH